MGIDLRSKSYPFLELLSILRNQLFAVPGNVGVCLASQIFNRRDAIPHWFCQDYPALVVYKQVYDEKY